MRRIGLVVVLALSLVLEPLAAEAQAPGKVSRLGILTGGPSSLIDQELRRLGYIEERNILIRRRYTYGGFEATSRLATEIVEFRPDVVLVTKARWREPYSERVRQPPSLSRPRATW